eukprot:TRINITY_DN3853_c0_g1_i1.p1 TRINITY_DN3853_c0_g1~~TRINITY_DN3853_c0_g1_i1.p1  ORF type:complete len:151 (+),score=21.52 TRINITY_DN3853_c0_g1_i1:53-505(+)
MLRERGKRFYFLFFFFLISICLLLSKIQLHPKQDFVRRELSFKVIQFGNSLWNPVAAVLGYNQIQTVERSTEGVVVGFPWIFVDKNSQEINDQLTRKLEAQDPAETRTTPFAGRLKRKFCYLVLEPLTWGYRLVDVELGPETSKFGYLMK